MPLTLWLSMATFAFVTSITPGPNNLMLTASGARFGFARTLPHIVGIEVGFFLLLLATALGLGELFSLWPPAQTVLRGVGAAYLLWLAWQLLRDPGHDNDGGDARPLAVWQAAVFQVVNPKAWMMAVSSMGTFTLPGDAYLPSAIVVAVTFAIVGIPCAFTWAGFGTVIRRYLHGPRARRVVNGVLAVLTLGAVAMLLW